MTSAPRIPFAVDLEIEEFASGVIVTPASLLTNLVLSQRPSDGRFFVTQRPAVNITNDASLTVSDARGRGCYYWNAVSAMYFANAADIYKASYGTTVREAALTIGAGNLTGSGTTASVAYVAHGYVNGDTIVVSGATQTEYNGTFTVSNVAANTFDYTLSTAATASPATTASSITMRRTIKSDVTKLYFFELDTYLVILDPEDNRGWYVASGASTTLVKITDADFPTTLTKGGTVLNGRLYVLDETGILYASDEGNPTSWSALNIIEANYSPDAGVACGGHNKHVVTYGANTIEFFYDNANPTGSPLSKRLDGVHEIGTITEDTIWTDNNITFFIGISRSGGLTVYVLSGFQVQAISSPEVDSFLTTAYMKEGKHFHASGAVVGGRVFYLLTVYHQTSSTADVTPLTTLVFNSVGKTKNWGVWELMHSGIDRAPLVDWTLSTPSTTAKGILTNGDIITFQDDLNPEDLTLASGLYESGLYESGLYAASGGSGTPISFEIVTGAKDFKTMNWKRMDSLRIVGNRTSASETLTVSVSDEVNDDWTQVGTIDLSIPGERINRLGSFRQRNIKLTGAFSERMEIEGAEVEVRGLRA